MLQTEQILLFLKRQALFIAVASTGTQPHCQAFWWVFDPNSHWHAWGSFWWWLQQSRDSAVCDHDPPKWLAPSWEECQPLAECQSLALQGNPGTSSEAPGRSCCSETHCQSLITETWSTEWRTNSQNFKVVLLSV